MTYRERPLIYAHIGDLHLTTRDERNASDLSMIVDELCEFGNFLDFVYLPGDNADNGSPDQYALVKDLLKPIAVPVHIITGDHDMEGGNLDAFYTGLEAARLPKAIDAGGVRCLFLDISGPGRGGPDFRLGSEQAKWLREEIREVRRSKIRCAVFMHTYPADLRGEGETALVNEILAMSEILLVDMGHTHYNEISNDGQTIFAATRSTGQIEEGPVGYTLVTIDGRTVSWRFRELGASGPVVLITTPADGRLATDANDRAHAPTGAAVSVRTSVLGTTKINSCVCSIDDGTARPMRCIAPGRYEISLTVPSDARMLRVEARAWDGSVGAETIQFADAGHFATARYADGSDADSIGSWPERGLLGTQLGPNRNGRQW